MCNRCPDLMNCHLHNCSGRPMSRMSVAEILALQADTLPCEKLSPAGQPEKERPVSETSSARLQVA